MWDISLLFDEWRTYLAVRLWTQFDRDTLDPQFRLFHSRRCHLASVVALILSLELTSHMNETNYSCSKLLCPWMRSGLSAFSLPFALAMKPLSEALPTSASFLGARMCGVVPVRGQYMNVNQKCYSLSAGFYFNSKDFLDITFIFRRAKCVPINRALLPKSVLSL